MTSIEHQTIVRGDPAQVFLDGSQYWIAELRSVRVGVGHFRPGWVWSKHVGADTGRDSEAHIGYIQSGAMTVRDAHGHEAELGAGDAFEVGPGHDAWVVGEESCIAVDMALKRDV